MDAPPRLLRDLEDVVGRAHLLTDPDVVAGACADWTGRFVAAPAPVVRPADTAEVAAVVEACRTAGCAVVPQGGNTGLVGGGVPLEGGVVVSLVRLTDLELDATAAQLTVGGGATVAAAQEAGAALGLDYAVDLASRDRATIGGTVATNAVGLRGVRFGDTRAQVVAVEAVLGTGRVVSHMAGPTRDNTGYHLPSLLTGSEGTLGLVTRARVRLVPRRRSHAVALLGFATALDAVAAIAALRRAPVGIEAVELMLHDGVALVCEVFGLAPPLPAPHAAYVLVEAAGDDDVLAPLVEALASVAPLVRDSAVASDAPRRAALWRYREGFTEAINRVGTPHKLDVALPAATLAGFVDEVGRRVHEQHPAARCWLFGHAADGNVHVNVTGVDPDDDTVDDVVLRLVADLGGSISGEHGIGRAKRRWLHLNRSDAELATFRALKSALDPDGIMNPGVLLP